ncbi:MAG: succinylglutamate desuccinylase/aspartoacylase family protein, partial [Planctomycetes bacterium]|nr:succinylglutamate desuccinylase/aspartoacylase family protein [Planctomycetota bacterium]
MRSRLAAMLSGFGFVFSLAAQDTPPEPDPGAGDYAALLATVDGWIERHPMLVSRVELGTSVAGRPLFALRIGRQDDGAPEVYLGAGIHGHEHSEEDLLFMVDQLLLRRDDPDVARLLRARTLWAQPLVNPDGMVARERKNAHGVDLNRNFPYKWKDLDGNYESGSKPASEPETKAVMKFLRTVKPRRILSFHQPLNGVDTDTKKPKFAKRVARALKLPAKSFDCGSVCHGTMTQWYNH